MDNFTWTLYTDSPKTWEAMLADCKLAKKSIDIEQYIFDGDIVGSKFINLLREKNKEGVKIRLLIDMIGSMDFYNSRTPDMLRSEGIEVKFFNVVSPWRIFKFTNLFLRDHKKILVVDGVVGFTGGLGIRDNMTEWRDTTVRVEGKVVTEMLDTLNEMWKRAEDHGVVYMVRRFRNQIKRNNYITNDPYFKKRFLYYSFIEAIRSAKKYVYITNPYFIPDRRLARVLRLAKERGVDIKILIPEKSDVPLIESASNSTLEKLLKNGIRFYRYLPEFLHAKSAVIDDNWATVGSFNLDSLSFTFNHEANLVTYNPLFAVDVKNMFLKDLEQAKEIKYEEWKLRPTTDRVREFFISFIRGFL